ncbi:PmoA family protein [Micromonospora cathayae]|uniref:PmoA family protein n=1 Tax=Micromonospora cathayae TaxID=3028804 RepID=A0ABY7ZIH2_9ACTN|nr:PmoA family protein [Micromonospora sp. HUAS 3]WDZ82790.1 PmoA family protein [Micromonospora sp. HUAS 3]
MTDDDPRLLVADREVARYVLDPDLDAKHGPRPYLHPVRTLAGTPVTDTLPEDHVWHLGASLAVQDVDGTNLWGGRTYVRDTGYTWRDDHGRISHDGWFHREADRLEHRLRWCDRDGGLLLTERRRLAARPVDDRAWTLEVDYTLTAPDRRDVTLGSPATNGRPGGAGYGGFFWRAAAGPTPPRVLTAKTDGEEQVNGSAEPWVAMLGTNPDGVAWTLLFVGLPEGDRWFVRASMYPGVCSAFAFDEPRVIPAGTSRPGRHRIAVVDGHLDRDALGALAERLDRP